MPAVIEIDPEDGLMDEPLAVRARGLSPGVDVRVRAELVDAAGRRFLAEATFEADGDGNVDPSNQPAKAGNYRGIDPAGLLWSMRPWTGEAEARPDGLGPEDVTFTLEQDKRTLAEARALRRTVAPDVERVTVRDRGVLGALYLPPGASKARQAVLVLGGSAGGMPEPTAALLASRGFAALALAYFGVEGLPDRLELISIESLERGLEWLAGHCDVAAEAVGVLGLSKGGEAALTLAAYCTQPRAVVAYVPSGVVYQGLGRGRPKSSWTVADEPLPFLPIPARHVLPPLARGAAARALRLDGARPSLGAVSFAPAYRSALRDRESVKRAAIPVERIACPILLVSAGRDRVWPSEELCELMERRLEQMGGPHRLVHLRYPQAGHDVAPPPNRPSTIVYVRQGPLILDLGGEPAATATARADAWTRTLDFLRREMAADPSET